jgi:imidazolonepropionase
MQPCDLLLHSASQLLTLSGGVQRGAALGSLHLIQDGAVAIAGDLIVAVGASSDLRAAFAPRSMLDASRKVVMPGFVDPHTHLIWAGDRANEFEMRLAGKSYMEIMNAGGGIMSTVRQTRAASVDQLVDQARPRLQRMLAHGTTTVEAKTGYGLETQAELRSLEAIARLNAEGLCDLVPTFIGAHAVPAEYKGREDAYVDLVVDEMLPAVRQWRIADRLSRKSDMRYAISDRLFCDVFCEDGAFTLAQSRHILERAKEMGFGLKIHADEFVGLGGARLAVELGAASADHLVYTPDEDIAALGRGETVAVGLPGTPFGLAQKDYTPAQKILAANGVLALATDLNPGTTWCESMQMVIALACRYMKLTPAQAIAAATLNAARAIRREDAVGSLEPGKQADVLVLDAPDYRFLGYRYGTNLVQTVIKSGRVVVENQ